MIEIAIGVVAGAVILALVLLLWLVWYTRTRGPIVIHRTDEDWMESVRTREYQRGWDDGYEAGLEVE